MGSITIQEGKQSHPHRVQAIQDQESRITNDDHVQSDNINDVYISDYQKYGFNDDNDHVFANEEYENIVDKDALDVEVLNQNSFTSIPVEDSRKANNPFESENLALNFNVNTPEGFSLFKNGEDKYSAFNPENILENSERTNLNETLVSEYHREDDNKNVFVQDFNAKEYGSTSADVDDNYEPGYSFESKDL